MRTLIISVLRRLRQDYKTFKASLKYMSISWKETFNGGRENRRQERWRKEGRKGREESRKEGESRP